MTLTPHQKKLAETMELNYDFMSLQDAYNEFEMYSKESVKIAWSSIKWRLK
jgi:hypothetical protein